MLTKVDSTGTTTYAWDYENRLTSVALPGSGGTVSFTYDPLGRRIKKTSSSATTNYVYDGSNALEEVDSSGNVLARYVQSDGIDEPLAETRSSVTSYYESDGVRSITSLSNSSAGLTNSYTYDSFGRLTGSTGTVTNPYRYTGREFDPETGLYYYRARYYDPMVGRFLSEDPVSNQGAYPYASNSPVNATDPLGLFPTWDHKAITRQAALNAGYSEADAEALADLVVGVDFLPGSQLPDAEDANLHAMSGKKPNGSFQKCSEAYQGSQEQVARYLTNGNPAAIAAAIHTIQDSYSPAHAGYQRWDGGYTRWHIPGISHMWGDGVADYSRARLDALVATQQLLRDLKDNNPALKNPSNYLNQCKCKE